jgi:ABC-2 type transport system ATP-binding protein
LGKSEFHILIVIDVENLGANGAGKTTTFRMLINDLKPTSGEIFINGRNINKIVAH